MKFTGTAALALGISLASPLVASAQPSHHSSQRNHMHVEGRIVSMQGSNFTLDSGATIFLKPGTVINATSGLHTRQYVTVDGSRSGTRNVNATEVDVTHRR